MIASGSDISAISQTLHVGTFLLHVFVGLCTCFDRGSNEVAVNITANLTLYSLACKQMLNDMWKA